MRLLRAGEVKITLKVEHLLSGEDLLRRGMEVQGGDSKNFLWKFVRFFITLGLKNLEII